MRGIQFIQDNSGRKVKALVDLRVHGESFAAYLKQIENQARKPEPQKATPPPSNNKVQTVLQTLRSFLNTPYRTGGTTRSGMDCSGLTSVVFKAAGIHLPRVSRDQAQVGQAVQERAHLQPGDLVYFSTGRPGRVNHVGVVSENTGKDVKFIHASSSRGVMESALSNRYWNGVFMGARRVV